MAAEVSKIGTTRNKLFSIEARESDIITHQYFLHVGQRGVITFQSDGPRLKMCIRKYLINSKDWSVMEGKLLPAFFDKYGNRFTYPGVVSKIVELTQNDHGSKGCELFRLL